MPASSASAGYGARFFIREGVTYVPVAEVASITPPGWTRETIDVTNLESPDETREYIASLADAGEATITVNFLPSLTDKLLTAFTAKSGEFRVLLPGGTIGLDFDGIVTGYEIGDLVADDKMSATFTVKPTGKPVFTSVTP